MQIVINIPKEEYELIVGDEACGLNPLTRAIAHGTPLDDMLNKIRIEIDKMDYLIVEDGSDGYNNYVDKYEVFKVLYKYKTESEDN